MMFVDSSIPFCSICDRKENKKMTNANKDISPESLNMLITYRELSYYASPIQSPVSQHRCCNIYIFTPFV